MSFLRILRFATKYFTCNNNTIPFTTINGFCFVDIAYTIQLIHAIPFINLILLSPFGIKEIIVSRVLIQPNASTIIFYSPFITSFVANTIKMQPTPISPIHIYAAPKKNAKGTLTKFQILLILLLSILFYCLLCY